MHLFGFIVENGVFHFTRSVIVRFHSIRIGVMLITATNGQGEQGTGHIFMIMTMCAKQLGHNMNSPQMRQKNSQKL